MEVRLRFPGTDLWSGHKALQSEVSLMFLLLGAVYVHHLPRLLQQFGVDPSLLDDAAVHIGATVAVLLAPGAVAAAADALMRAVAGERDHFEVCCAVLCCAVLCCAVLCCAVLCCAVQTACALCCRFDQAGQQLVSAGCLV